MEEMETKQNNRIRFPYILPTEHLQTQSENLSFFFPFSVAYLHTPHLPHVKHHIFVAWYNIVLYEA